MASVDVNKLVRPNAVSPDFPFVNLTGASLRNVDLPGAFFAEAHLDRVDFSYARLPGAAFATATGMAGTKFDHANLTWTIFKGLDLRQVSFIDADLSFADLSNTDLRGVDLSYTNLTGANLTGARR